MSSASHHIGPDSAPDRYRLLRSIGRGGEAVLYLAEIELAGGTEPVVVKVLDSKTTITPEIFERVSRKWNEQAELLRFVSRPGVVGVREHFQGSPIHAPGESGTLTGRALVLVMNHVDGLDLRDWRAERTLATPAERREVMRTLEQLADVLDWLHSGKATPSGRTVVHGDLSPGNVMVDEHGQATLVDFGLSKLTADHQTAEVWFTPGYAAPEIFEGKRTPATDRYAFGAIAYFLLSGQSPPATPEQLAAAFVTVPQIAALPEEQRRKVLAITAADADKRPLSLSSWVKEVRHGVVSTTTTSRPATPQDAPPKDAAPKDATPQDAVPPRPADAPTVPPLPVAPPVGPPPAEPPAQPAPAPTPQAAAPTPPPAQPVQPPASTPTPTPTPAPVGYDAGQGAYGAPAAGVPAYGGPGYGGQGFGPPTAGMPTVGGPGGPTGSLPQRSPAPRKRRKGPLIGAVAGVLLVAVLAVVGVRLLADKDAEDGKNDQAGGATTSATTGATTETPSDKPTTDAPTEEPTGEAPTGEPSTDAPADSASPSVDPGSVPDSKQADLTSLTPVDGLDGFTVTSSATLNAKDYGSAFVAGCSDESYMEFNLGRAWETLEFTAGIDDDSPTEEARISISVDDQPAPFAQAVSLGKPVAKSISVKGALRLRIRVEDTCSFSQEALVVIASPVLKR
ncbi:serine/threonine protein kinase [Streptomyces sp. R302]|uniref:serine/threonine protein kinase n=1 Tax=unclassified Streptomyces TaxID=2593676 RepID=UPI00145F5EEF|nr:MULTISPECIES: serine/threonine-protein kinase [unclassified Streptomyces]NML53384.1 serine/threonine protein kinase [Streptomyces sp. R301]NML78338.1 serine/threonine protein kinase [Streptomyces sp. R302]